MVIPNFTNTMIRFFSLIFFLFTVLIISSCDDLTSTGKNSSGKTAEMIVVTNNQAKWEGRVGDTISKFFNKEFDVLPQPEPLFEISHIPAASFTDNAMFQAHHNVFILDIDNSLRKSRLDVQKDEWASPQTVIRLSAPTEEDLIVFFEESKKSILTLLMKSERERLINTFNKFRDAEVIDELKNHSRLTLELPSGFYIAKKTADFIWIRKETPKISQGIMIYTYDFVDTIAFDVSRIIAFRNSMTEEYIPGPSEGSFMKVSEDFLPVTSKRIDFNGKFAVETRGLWKLEQDFMGGPFINYTLVDGKRNKVITLDGYVYAPNAPKRDLMIQMEALIYSLKFEDGF
jgi:hypothetical protein